MPAFSDALLDALQLLFDAIQKNIDQVDFEIMAACEFDQSPILPAGQYGFDANGLMHPDRGIQPCFNALNRCQIGIEQRQLFSFLQPGSQQVWIDDPYRTVKSDKVIATVSGTLA